MTYMNYNFIFIRKFHHDATNYLFFNEGIISLIGIIDGKDMDPNCTINI